MSKYALCKVEWKDDHSVTEEVFKLSCDYEEDEDMYNDVLWYTNGIGDIERCIECDKKRDKSGSSDFWVLEIVNTF